MKDTHYREVIASTLHKQIMEAYPGEPDIDETAEAIADALESWGYMHYNDAAHLFGFKTAQEAFNHAESIKAAE